MALIACPECCKQISDQATACPNCGFPITSKMDVNSEKAADAERVKTINPTRASIKGSEPESGEDEETRHTAGVRDRTENPVIEILNKDGAVLLRVPGNTLAKANLARQYLRGAQLANCDLRGAVLVGADLKGADLTGCDLSDADLEDAVLADACLRGARFSGAQHQFSVERADMTEVDLRDVEWAGVNARNANLSSANLSNASFFGVVFYGADLRGANLDRAKFIKSDLYFANVVGTDLSRAEKIDVFSAKFDDGLGPSRRCNVSELRFDRTTKWPRSPYLLLKSIYYGGVLDYAGGGASPGFLLVVGGLVAAQFSPLLGGLLFWGGLLAIVVGGLVCGIYRLVRDFVFEWDKQPW